jgi:GNAT superfamily N-acetyltransferase
VIRLADEADLDALEEAGRSREQLERYLAEQRAGLRLVLIALAEDAAAGYLTLAWQADYPPFRREGIPEIQDLYVLPARRRAGIASLLMDAAEEHAATRSARVGLGVGIYAAYGPAHVLYARRGYLPDGAGATASGRTLEGGEVVSADDSLVLHLVKRLASI